MLNHVLLADLPRAVEKLIERIQNVSAVASDVGHLMEALPALASVLRYGNVRKTDLSMLEPIVAGLMARICAGLGPACGSLDDDAAGGDAGPDQRGSRGALHPGPGRSHRAVARAPDHAGGC